MHCFEANPSRRGVPLRLFLFLLYGPAAFFVKFIQFPSPGALVILGSFSRQKCLFFALDCGRLSPY